MPGVMRSLELTIQMALNSVVTQQNVSVVFGLIADATGRFSVHVVSTVDTGVVNGQELCGSWLCPPSKREAGIIIAVSFWRPVYFSFALLCIISNRQEPVYKRSSAMLQK